MLEKLHEVLLVFNDLFLGQVVFGEELEDIHRELFGFNDGVLRACWLLSENNYVLDEGAV